MCKTINIKRIVLSLLALTIGLQISAKCPSSINVCCGWNAIQEASDDFLKNCDGGTLKIVDLGTGHVHYVIKFRKPPQV
jgi:hypothetical protein